MFNRQSVQSAIKSAQQRIKLYNKCPKNGLIVYCGLAITDTSNGKDKQLSIHFEPFRPIKKFLYRCDNRFHTENLNTLLLDEGAEPYGFIVMDGNGTLFGKVQGATREVLHKFSVHLPNKHSRGGQSAQRFSRLRLEKRHNYVRRVAELATKFFIFDDRPNVKGVVLAGSADFKVELLNSSVFDKRLQSIVLKTVDISHGGESGFEQAITMSVDAIGSVALLREKRLLEQYMEAIHRDSGRYCFSVKDTFNALEMGAVEDLMIWENLDVNRYELRNPATKEETVVFVTKEEEPKSGGNYFRDSKTGDKLDIVQNDRLVEWLCDNYKKFGCKLHFVSDRSGFGRQFVLGFGGFGGLLRWRVDFADHAAYEEVVATGSQDVDTTGIDSESNTAEYGFDDGDFGF